jgi:2-dehydro-3-deoxygalactonokinase
LTGIVQQRLHGRFGRRPIAHRNRIIDLAMKWNRELIVARVPVRQAAIDLERRKRIAGQLSAMDISWIAVDWGTTRLRVWAIGRGLRVMTQASSAKGMNSLAPDQFEAALLELVDDWLPAGRQTLVIACGMVGARQGWVEADYARIPAPPISPGRFATAVAEDPRLKVLIIPGLARSDPADVMRGEETQIAGLLAERPDFEGTVCMPGTHSKWARIRDAKVFDFMTCMTGELFALLERQSILRHSLRSPGFDSDAYDAAIADARKSPDLVLSKLFSIRADDLINGVEPSVSRARLSAYVIAAEIHAARPQWHGQRVVVLASDELATLYNTALLAAGADVEIVDGAGLTVRGLIAARAMTEDIDDA